MFRMLNFQGVAHSDGYAVQVMDRESVRYSEGDHHLLISAVLGYPDIGLSFSSATAWEAPYEREPITPADRKRIRGRLQEGMTAIDAPCVFIGDESGM